MKKFNYGAKGWGIVIFCFFAILKTDFSRADTERPLFYCIRGVSENKFTAFRMHPKGAYFRTHETYELRKGNDHEENRF